MLGNLYEIRVKDISNSENKRIVSGKLKANYNNLDVNLHRFQPKHIEED